MAMYLGNKKVAVTNTIEKQVPSMKAFFEAGGKCVYSEVQSFNGLIKYEDTSNLYSMYRLFENCKQLESIPLLDTSKVTSMQSTFGYCEYLTSIPDFNTPNLNSLNHTFTFCIRLKKAPNISTVKVTNWYGAFYQCKSITELNLETQSATDMRETFSNCGSLVKVSLSNVSKVLSFDRIFQDCINLKEVSGLETTYGNFTMNQMFSGCKALVNAPMVNLSEVKSTSQMFYGCSSLVNVPIYDLTSVTDTSYMFSYCSNLETIHMININTNLDIHASTKFTREALLEIIGNLKAQTSGSKKLTMGSTNLAKLTDEDKAIATNKGWTLA